MTDIAAIKERHVMGTPRWEPGLAHDEWANRCKYDGQTWPCDVAALLADTPSVGPAGLTECAVPSVCGKQHVFAHFVPEPRP